MKILVADDHPLVRDALVRTLEPLVPGATLLQAASLAEAEGAIATALPVLALLDLHMPGMHEAAAAPALGGGVMRRPPAAAPAPVGADPAPALAQVRRLRQLYPGTALVIVSAHEDPNVMRDAVAAGAAAFLPKSEAPAVMQHAISLVLGGGTYLPAAALAAPPRANGRADGGLTPRQLDVLRCLMRGEPNKLIARELGLTEGTVKIHIAAILRTLQVRNRTEAVVVARRLGIQG